MPTKKVAIVTDSISCLTRELAAQYEIEIIPINFYAGGRVYRDWVDIAPTEAYELFLQDPDSFKSSAPSPEDCLQTFRAAAQHAGSIACITVSARLSGTNNSATRAKEMALTELPGTKIEVIDSLTATPSEGMVALAAARAAEAGKDLPEVIKVAQEVIKKVYAIVFLDTIKHAYRSGRIPKIASRLGSALNIKPILTVSRIVHFSGMAMNRQHGIERVLQMMREKVRGQPIHAAVMHAYALEEAERLKERVVNEFNCVEAWLAEFSPVMGYACGTGTVGVAFYPED
jgi:DegV family protein with EDD domain